MNIRKFLFAVLSLPLACAHADQANILWIDALFFETLQRAAAPPEQTALDGQLTTGVTRAAVATNLLGSQEFDVRTVGDAFERFLQRPASPAEVTNFTNALQSGMPDPVVYAQIIGSAEYFTVRGADTNLAFIIAAYGDILQRAPGTSEQSTAFLALNTGLARDDFAHQLLTGAEGRYVFVNSLYNDYLGRSASPPEAAPFEGLLASGGTWDQVRGLILGSEEYFASTQPPPPSYTHLAQAGIVDRALVGTPVEDVPGFSFTKLGTPVVSNLRRVASMAEARSSAGMKFQGVMLANVDQFGEWHFNMPIRSGANADIVEPGLTWKSVPKEPFMDYSDDAFADPNVDANPLTMGFFGRVQGPGVSARNDDVLAVYRRTSFSAGFGEVYSVVAREGGIAPGTGAPGSEARFMTFISAAIAEKAFPMAALDGEIAVGAFRAHFIAFTAKLQPGVGGVTKENDIGLWVWTGGQPNLRLREGQIVGTKTVKNFKALKERGHGHGWTVDSDEDHYPPGNPGNFSTNVLITFTDGSKQLASVSNHGVAVLANAKATEPWASDGLEMGWATFPSSFRNGNGQIGALIGLLKGGPINSSNSLGIFAEDIDGDLRQLLLKGDSAAGDGSVFVGFKYPVMNRQGALAFAATVKTPDGSGGFDTFKRGYHRDGSGVLKSFFEAAAPAPGANGGVWKTIASHALPDNMGPLFTSKLLTAKIGAPPAPGGVTGVDDACLHAVDPNGNTHLLMRENQQLFGKTVKKFKVLGVVGKSPAQARSFNSNLDVIVQVFASDKTIHHVHIAIPGGSRVVIGGGGVGGL